MQLTTLTKKSFKGFTLIELLVVIAIIGLLSTIVAAPIQSARKKAKDTKKLAEVRQMQTSLANYANDNGYYPSGSSTSNNPLNILSPQYIPSIPNGFNSSSTRDKYMYVSYQGQAPGASASSTFGYHLGATLEVFNTVLSSDDDCWGVVSTTSPNITGNKNGTGCGNYVEASSTNILAAQYYGSNATSSSAITGSASLLNGVTPVSTAISLMTTFAGYNFIAHPQWPSFTADFQGLGTNEAASSTCSTVDQCIYDVSDTY